MLNWSNSAKTMIQEIVNLLAKENCTVERANLILQGVKEVIEDTAPIVSVQFSECGINVISH